MAKNTIIKQNDSFLYILIFFLIGSIVYLLSKPETTLKSKLISSSSSSSPSYSSFYPIEEQIINNSTNNILNYNDPLRPPLKTNYSLTLRNNEYSQMGILTRATNEKHPIILPLMGRSIDRGNKLQYYTISNSGSNNTKLPIKKSGKYCTNERGCDELYSGDKVYVDGYEETFDVTIYENKPFEYIL